MSLESDSSSFLWCRKSCNCSCWAEEAMCHVQGGTSVNPRQKSLLDGIERAASARASGDVCSSASVLDNQLIQ